MEIKHATFKGGIHPSYNKQYTDKLPIETMPAPKEIVLPMSMHIGAPCSPVVEVGQEVKMGQLVGQAGGFVSANIHSSVSGKVKAIEKRLTGNGQKMMSQQMPLEELAEKLNFNLAEYMTPPTEVKEMRCV